MSNKPYKNTAVIEFADPIDPRRKEIVDLLSAGMDEGWCCYLSAQDDIHCNDNKGVESGDEFRHINNGHSATVLKVVFDIEEKVMIAVCDDESLTSRKSLINLDDLLNTKVWAKMGQADDEQ